MMMAPASYLYTSNKNMYMCTHMICSLLWRNGERSIIQKQNFLTGGKIKKILLPLELRINFISQPRLQLNTFANVNSTASLWKIIAQ
jgi:hypothetical protein